MYFGSENKKVVKSSVFNKFNIINRQIDRDILSKGRQRKKKCKNRVW